MVKVFKDQVDVQDTDSNLTISLNGNRAAIYAGGNGKPGSLRLKDGDGKERAIIGADGSITLRSADAAELIEIDGPSGTLVYRDSDGNQVLRFVSSRGGLDVGGAGNAGFVLIHDEQGEVAIRQDGKDASLRLGSDSQAGLVEVAEASGRSTIELDGGTAKLTIGSVDNGGDLKILDDEGSLMFHVTASLARLRGALVVGARNVPGNIGIMGPMGRPAIFADGGDAQLQLGNKGNAGDFMIRDNNASPVLEANGLTATLALGGNDKPGYVVVRGADGAEVARLSGKEAALFLGREGQAGEILILNKNGKSSFSVDGANSSVSVGTGDNRVLIDGSAGDIRLIGADCAEEFALSEAADVDPGTVLVIGENSALHPCCSPYDKRVAGVVSGANGVRPGIILNRQDEGNGTLPVSLNGRVCCKVDADYEPVGIGDLLTTSSTPGHAMRATDPHNAFGAVLGKALEPLETGTGLIPVLVSLI